MTYMIVSVFLKNTAKLPKLERLNLTVFLLKYRFIKILFILLSTNVIFQLYFIILTIYHKNIIIKQKKG